MSGGWFNREAFWCPECQQGKHVNCTNQSLDPTTDELVPCDCPMPHTRRPDGQAR
jgi:hypothetical protein